MAPITAPPRPGQYSTWWRALVAMLWIGVILALAAVWSASAQLGLSTWWLGPRGDRMPVYVNLLPFAGPLLMLLAVMNNARRLPWLGVLAAAPIVVFGIIDLSRVQSIGLIEIAIGLGAALASLASAAGTYRSAVADGTDHG